MLHGVIYVLPTPDLSTSKQSWKPKGKKNGRRDSASRDEMSPPTLSRKQEAGSSIKQELTIFCYVKSLESSSPETQRQSIESREKA